MHLKIKKNSFLQQRITGKTKHSYVKATCPVVARQQKINSVATSELPFLIMSCQGSSLKYILNFLFYLYIFSSLNPPRALCIYYDLQFSVFMKLLSVQTSESLFFLCHVLGIFLFCWFVFIQF